ncbi:MAG: DUF2304 domain-containing protein [Syntrophorhabdaceae bacterium]|nr:DUF2304 domain-containing protein [Syntrophorhabdaceae bacterium]
MNRLAILSVVTSTLFLLGILELVRRRRLREEYSILWLFGSVIILVLSVKQSWLNWISTLVGISYPPSFLFLVGMFFIFMILIHFSIVISKLMRMNKRLIQEIALLKSSLPPEEPPQNRKEQ